MPEVGQLEITIKADAAEAIREMQRARKEFSAAGDAASGADKKIQSSFGGIGDSARQAAAGAQSSAGSITGLVKNFLGLGDSAAGSARQIASTGGAFLGLSGGAVAAAAATGGLVVAVSAMTAAFDALATAAGLAFTALETVFSQGVKYNQTIESARIGIAGVLTGAAEIQKGGFPLSGAEKFAAATTVAADQMKKLLVDSLKTSATFSQIVPAFQNALGPGLAVGLNPDQVRELTVKIVQAAGALGISGNQLAQEVRSIFQGDTGPDSRINQILRVTVETLRNAQKTGSVFDLLNKKLEGFAISGDAVAQSFAGLKSNAQELFENLSGQATKGAFDRLRGALASSLSQIFDINTAKVAPQLQQIATDLDGFFTRLVGVAASAVQGLINFVKGFGDALKSNRDLVTEIGTAFDGLIAVVSEIVRGVARSTSETITWRDVLQFVRNLIVGITETIRFLSVVFSKSVALASAIAPAFAPFSGALGRAGDATAALNSRLSGIVTTIGGVLSAISPLAGTIFGMAQGLAIIGSFKAPSSLSGVAGSAAGQIAGSKPIPQRTNQIGGNLSRDEFLQQFTSAGLTVKAPPSPADKKKAGGSKQDPAAELLARLREETERLTATTREQEIAITLKEKAYAKLNQTQRETILQQAREFDQSKAQKSASDEITRFLKEQEKALAESERALKGGKGAADELTKSFEFLSRPEIASQLDAGTSALIRRRAATIELNIETKRAADETARFAEAFRSTGEGLQSRIATFGQAETNERRVAAENAKRLADAQTKGLLQSQLESLKADAAANLDTARRLDQIEAAARQTDAYNSLLRDLQGRLRENKTETEQFKLQTKLLGEEFKNLDAASRATLENIAAQLDAQNSPLQKGLDAAKQGFIEAFPNLFKEIDKGFGNLLKSMLKSLLDFAANSLLKQAGQAIADALFGGQGANAGQGGQGGLLGGIFGRGGGGAGGGLSVPGFGGGTINLGGARGGGLGGLFGGGGLLGGLGGLFGRGGGGLPFDFGKLGKAGFDVGALTSGGGFKGLGGLFGGGGFLGGLGGLFGRGGGGLKGLGGLFGGIGKAFGGFFAAGGRPLTGGFNVVGERGPEIFVPDRPGTILNRQQLQAVAGTTNNRTTNNRNQTFFKFDIKGDTPVRRANAQAVARETARRLRSAQFAAGE